ncbi:MAG: DUF3617 domain-containing protein [Usitatibacter sp.]
MRTQFLIAAACAAAVSATAFAANPFDQYKGKLKEGMYEYKMNMEMPGMPAGMGNQTRTFQHCVTQKDIDEGQIGKGGERKQPERCEVKDFKMSGNTSTYTMVCKDDKGAQAMTADNKITFGHDSFNMDMKMAMNQGGQVMNMTQHMEGRYVGPCKK